jgi:hypothetical protein
VFTDEFGNRGTGVILSLSKDDELGRTISIAEAFGLQEVRMNILGLSRPVLGTLAAVAMLSDCGGSGMPLSPSPAGVGAERTHKPPAYRVLYSFRGGSDGAFPNAGLTNVNGTFYGTTSDGGGGC